MKIGVLRETRRWNDRRTPITPETAELIRSNHPNVELYIQSSKIRVHTDDEYRKADIPVVEDLSHCDILIGVKEVAEEALIEGKTYIMFAHVAKKQAYNKRFFQALARKKITLIDYEYLTDVNQNRLVAFGFWAGVVGTYYAFQGLAKRYCHINLPGPEKCVDLNDLHHQLQSIPLPSLKILITGGGRVASGALEIIHALKLKEVSSKDFLTTKYDHPVFVRLDPEDYVVKESGRFSYDDFFANPQNYKSNFSPYLNTTDIFIACHFWNNESPHFFSADQLRSTDFSISLIADISCDVPGPIPTTVRTSTIEEPFYDIDPEDLSEKPAFSAPNHVNVMAVDNLPTALPLDASRTFSKDLYHHVFPSLFVKDESGIIKRATILQNGQLTDRFSYLNDFLENH